MSHLLLFLALSLFSGLLEIGSVLAALKSGFPPWAPFLLALGYQAGTVVTSVEIGRRGKVVLLIGAASGAAALAVSFDLVLLAAATAMASAVVNQARDDLGKASIPTTAKRLARISGFLLAPAFLIEAIVPVALGAAVIVAAWGMASSAGRSARRRTTSGQGRTALPIAAALVVHQMHYFVYSTMALVTLVTAFGPQAGTWLFLAGWLSYIAAPHLIGRADDPAKVALFGHVILTTVLAAMVLASSGGTVWTGLWIATGLFGGTVVYLTRHAELDYAFEHSSLVALENAGHVMGSGLALVLVSTGFPQSQLVLVASGLASLTAVLLVASRAQKMQDELPPSSPS